VCVRLDRLKQLDSLTQYMIASKNAILISTLLWSCLCLDLLRAVSDAPTVTSSQSAIMLSADKETATIDLTGDDMEELHEEKREEKGVERVMSVVVPYDIRRHLPTIRLLVNEVDTRGIKLVSDGQRAPNVCLLSRYRDDTLRALWEVIKDNHTELTTDEHKNNGVLPCWLWTEVSGIATLENGYPVLSTRASLSKNVKMPYIKIHQLAAFIATGHKTGLGKGAATMQAPPGSRKKEWLLVASHLCHTKRCMRPEHVWPEPNGWNADRGACRGHNECTCRGNLQGGKKCLLAYKA